MKEPVRERSRRPLDGNVLEYRPLDFPGLPREHSCPKACELTRRSSFSLALAVCGARRWGVGAFLDPCTHQAGIMG